MRTMRGPTFYMGEKLKLHKSIKEQIAHLKSRGVIIEDEQKAGSFLQMSIIIDFQDTCLSSENQGHQISLKDYPLSELLIYTSLIAS